MTGPEHYRKAEQFAENAMAIYARADSNPAESAWHQQQALVHATLALVKATVDQYDPDWGPDPLDEYEKPED